MHTAYEKKWRTFTDIQRAQVLLVTGYTTQIISRHKLHDF